MHQEMGSVGEIFPGAKLTKEAVNLFFQEKSNKLPEIIKIWLEDRRNVTELETLVNNCDANFFLSHQNELSCLENFYHHTTKGDIHWTYIINYIQQFEWDLDDLCASSWLFEFAVWIFWLLYPTQSSVVILNDTYYNYDSATTLRNSNLQQALLLKIVLSCSGNLFYVLANLYVQVVDEKESNVCSQLRHLIEDKKIEYFFSQLFWCNINQIAPPNTNELNNMNDFWPAKFALAQYLLDDIATWESGFAQLQDLFDIENPKLLVLQALDIACNRYRNFIHEETRTFYNQQRHRLSESFGGTLAHEEIDFHTPSLNDIDNYQIICKISEGCDAVVLLGTIGCKTVAIKIIPPLTKLFNQDCSQQECIASHIRSPHIIRILTQFERTLSESHRFVIMLRSVYKKRKFGTGEYSFLVLERHETTLESKTAEIWKSPLPVTHQIDQLLQYGIEVAEGLLELYNNDIIHTDIKLNNILVSFSGHIVIADFGASLTRNSDGYAQGELRGNPLAQPIEFQNFDSADQVPWTLCEKLLSFALGIVIRTLFLDGENDHFNRIEQIMALAETLRSDDPFERPTLKYSIKRLQTLQQIHYLENHQLFECDCSGNPLFSSSQALVSKANTFPNSKIMVQISYPLNERLIDRKFIMKWANRWNNGKELFQQPSTYDRPDVFLHFTDRKADTARITCKIGNLGSPQQPNISIPMAWYNNLPRSSKEFVIVHAFGHVLGIRHPLDGDSIFPGEMVQKTKTDRDSVMYLCNVDVLTPSKSDISDASLFHSYIKSNGAEDASTKIPTSFWVAGFIVLVSVPLMIYKFNRIRKR